MPAQFKADLAIWEGIQENRKWLAPILGHQFSRRHGWHFGMPAHFKADLASWEGIQENRKWLAPIFAATRLAFWDAGKPKVAGTNSRGDTVGILGCRRNLRPTW
jgi:hypothetical protein